MLHRIPRKVDDSVCRGQDIDRLDHYGQLYGDEAAGDSTDGVGQQQHINPAFFFDSDTEANTRLCLDLFAREQSYREFRETGVHRIRVNKLNISRILVLEIFCRQKLLRTWSS